MKFLFGCIFAVTCTCSLVAIAEELLDRPTVYTSTETGQCVFIQFADGTRADCSELDQDEKYYHAWAK